MPSPVLYDYAKLRAWRDQAGLDRTRAAADCGISYPWLRALETGNLDDRAPSLATLDRIARYYGHHLSELIVPAVEVAS